MSFIEHLNEKNAEPVLNPDEVIQNLHNESRTIDRMVHDSATGLETKIRLLNNKINLFNETILLFLTESLKLKEKK